MGESFSFCCISLIVLTCLVSIRAFRSTDLVGRLIFEPQAILAGKEFHRLVTSAFLHADMRHLGLNMITLYLFGSRIESVIGPRNFLLIYFAAVTGGSLLSLFVHRHHEYRALGASGGVCGMVFAYILLMPGDGILIFPLPFYIPAWLYAIGFMLGSFFGMKENNRGDIGHDAHLGGAIVGMLAAAALYPQSVRYNLRIFLIVLVLSIALLIYLWINPLFLPLHSFSLRPNFQSRRQPNRVPKTAPRPQMDDILDKISKHGIESLTAEEKQVLQDESRKLGRRSDSRKPDSGLAI